MRVLFPLFIALVSLLCADSARAASLDLDPSELTIRVQHGETIARKLHIRTSSDVDTLAVEPCELAIDKQPRAYSLPGQRLTMEETSKTGSSRLWVYPLDLDFRDMPSGEYSGSLVFVHASGSVKIPIKIQVRDRPWLPLVVLFVGILVGVGLSAYRSHGRPRDVLLMRLGFLRSYVQQDPLLRDAIFDAAGGEGAGEASRSGAESSDGKAAATAARSRRTHPFRAQLETLLVQVELSLQAEQLETARSHLSQADELFGRYVTARTEWARQLCYLAALRDRVQARTPSGAVVRQALLGRIDDSFSTAPSLGNPGVLAANAQRFVDQLTAYEALCARLTALEAQIVLFATDTPPRFRDQLTALRRRADDNPPTVDALSALQKEADEAIAAVQAAQAAAAAAAAANAGDSPDDAPMRPLGDVRGVALDAGAAVPGMEPVPVVQSMLLSQHAPQQAAQRLQIFLYGSYGVLLVLLAGTGLNEVYGRNFTFGAQPFTDYLTLLLWGFGAEATRDSIVSTLRGLGGERGKDAGAGAPKDSPSVEPAKPGAAPDLTTP